MKFKSLSFLALGCMIGTLCSCNDDDVTIVDNAVPECTLESTHIRTEAGQKINIKGMLTDADGIKSILLWCPDLYMKKTIDLLEIYGEAPTEYELDYTFELKSYKKAEQYEVEVTVTDVANNETKQTVLVTFDGDYTAPFFVAAPGAETTVLKNEDETTLTIEFCVTDNKGLDRVVIELNKYDLSTKEVGETVSEYFPMLLEAYGEDTYEYAEDIPLPAEEGAYLLSIEAFDLPAQFEEVRSSKITSIVTVLGGVDFAKMYLTDTTSPSELTADIFGVPMRVDKVGECQYRARYYNTKANTEIYFIPQKTALSPICYGVDPTDSSHLINSPGNVLPLVLPQANQYYEINFNTDSGEYEMHTYTVEDYMNPVFWEYGSNMLNTWWSWEDTGTDDWVGKADTWWQEFYFGYCEGPTDVKRFVKDSTNPNLYYWDTPMHFDAGEDLHFIIHNWHHDGWWNYCAWRVDDSAECDIFYYYGGVVKQAYLDWWYGEGVADWKQWAAGEDYRKELIYEGAGDKWCEPHVNASGDYLLYFDAHLGRAKLVPAN